MQEDGIIPPAKPTLYDMLIKLLSKWACHHKWEKHQRVNILDYKREAVGYEDTLICTECGKIKKIKM